MKSAIEKIVTKNDNFWAIESVINNCIDENRSICGSLRVSIPDTSFSPYVLTIETLEKGVKNFQS